MTSRKVGKLVETINAALFELREIKKRKPQFCVKVRDEPGSILNGYREGDISFDEAKERLERVFLGQYGSNA
jgi:hypothetical protein